MPARLAASAASASPAEPGRPGISGAAIEFDVTQLGGSAKISIANGSLDFPGIFEESLIPMEQLSVDAQWKFAGEKIEAQLRNLQFSNADAKGQAQASWKTEDVPGNPRETGAVDHRFPGILDLQGVLSRGNGARVHRYLPLVLPAEARHYVRDAVIAGEVSDVKFKVKGALAQLPFSSPAKPASTSNASQGEFRITAKVRNGQFAYVPPSIQPTGAAAWPALSGLNGELVFHRASLEVNNASAKVAGLPGLQLLKANARIPDMMNNATVEVNLDIKGALSDGLGFVKASPLADITGQALSEAVANGTADYRFKLGLPIHDIDKSRIEGRITLPGNDVQFTPSTPQLGRLRGVVAITERGFSVSGAQARVMGGDMRFDGGTRTPTRPPGNGQDAETSLAFRGQGTVTAEGLRQAKDMGVLSRLAQNASGTAAYTASLGFRQGIPEVSVSSTLQGLGLNLPAPLGKAPESALPLKFESALTPAGARNAGAPQDQLSVSLGQVATLVLVRDLSGPEAKVVRGGIGIGLAPDESVALPEAGVAANINLAQVDLDAWQKIIEMPASAAPGASSSVAAPGSASALSYLPTTMAIRAKELVVQGRKLNNVVVGGSRDGLTWRANIDASELNGYLEFRQAGGLNAGRVYARLSRLNIAPGSATDVEAILDEQPTTIPALDIIVDDLELRGKKLGRVEIDAVNRGASTLARESIREWRLNKFNITVPEATLTATGNWVALNAQGAGSALARGAGTQPERRRSVMNFRLDIADSGELLKRFGMGEVIRRGKGKLEGQIAWIGSPLTLDYPSMNGQFNVNVESGQFVKADPGIAKLLGVLSLQALPRRLVLDFRDVFSEGFTFDFVRGDVKINQGQASTNNLQMRGITAAVLMEGTADIARETQDIKVVVIPEINAGTASLIATVINPAIGLGSFLAQMFLSKPLIEAATQEFHIDGTWSDPKITKVNRNTRAAEPATEKR